MAQHAISLIGGIVWGIVGGIAMVIVMQARGGDAPPPFAVFWAKFVGDGNPDDAMPQALVLHFVNAAVYGLLFALIFARFNAGFPVTGYTGGVIWGIVWAVALLIVAMVFWGKLVLGMDPGQGQMMTIALAHLAYGLVLGVLAAAGASAGLFVA